MSVLIWEHLSEPWSIPDSCAIRGLESLTNSFMMRFSLRRGRYILLVYGWAHKTHGILDLFFNNVRITPARGCNWNSPRAQLWFYRFLDIRIEVSGLQCIMGEARPSAAENNGNINSFCLTSICFVPDWFSRHAQRTKRLLAQCAAHSQCSCWDNLEEDKQSVTYLVLLTKASFETRAYVHIPQPFCNQSFF